MKIGRRDRNVSGVNRAATGLVEIGLRDRAAVHPEEIGLQDREAAVPIVVVTAAVIADAKVDGPAAVGDPLSP